jgi:hypothetical protein
MALRTGRLSRNISRVGDVDLVLNLLLTAQIGIFRRIK